MMLSVYTQTTFYELNLNYFMPQFTIQKQNLAKMQIKEASKPSIKEGEILFKIEKYAFTANNMTYAVLGNRLKYWNFFPAEDPDLGIIPVWGFAEVVESKHEGIAVGEKCYGYFPMNDYLKVEAGRVNEFGFTDMVPHRQDMASIYNYYNRTATDPTYNKQVEDFIPIMKPLFVTSFLNYHYLNDADFFKANQIILTSASSKTALGLAFLLKQTQAEHGKKIIALTSLSNIDFVEKTGYYDEILGYDDLQKLALEDSLVIDFAGNAPRLQALADHLNENLKFISLVGIADWQASKDFKDIPNSELFFAPTSAKKKYAEWGIAEANRRIAEGLFAFIKDMKASIEITHLSKAEEVNEIYQQMIGGSLDPSKGYIVKL
jgi:hypothetical protein